MCFETFEMRVERERRVREGLFPRSREECEADMILPGFVLKFCFGVGFLTWTICIAQPVLVRLIMEHM